MTSLQRSNDDDDTAIASNVLYSKLFRAHALDHFLNSNNFAGAMLPLKTGNTITDSGAMQIFVMEGTPVINKRASTNPLTVLLVDGHQVSSTHMCNIHIEGLPFPLSGHIIPNLSIASLFGIGILTEVGCEVTFTKTTSVVKYNGNIILMGNKDQTTDLWTLPLGTPCMTAHHSHMAMTLLAALDFANTHAQGPQHIALFMHTMRNKANSIRFAHQSLCSPKISTLLKATCRGYLTGCPNLTAIGIAKYPNPSPATAKGHMKRPRMGICSTRCKNAMATITAPTLPPAPMQRPLYQ
jgi:hypothetical protein